MEKNVMSLESNQDRIEHWLRTVVVPIAQRVQDGSDKLYTTEEIREMRGLEREKRKAKR